MRNLRDNDLERASPSLGAKALVGLNRFYPQSERPRYFEVENYQNWLDNNGTTLFDQFYSRFANFAGKKILDIGCGYGGKISAYGKQNPEFVCGIDINVSVLREANEYSKRAPVPASFAGADGASLPFQDSAFDLVISDDGFDHFERPQLVIDEIIRVLKPNGIALISFVPYFSSECSHMSEYLRVPWHHVFFSRGSIRQALYLIEKQDKKQSPSDTIQNRPASDGVYNLFTNGLSRLTFRGFKRTLRNKKGTEIIRCRKQSKDWARLFTYLPFLNELFIDAVYCVVRKDSSKTIGPLAFPRQIMLDIAQDLRALGRRLSQR